MCLLIQLRKAKAHNLDRLVRLGPIYMCKGVLQHAIFSDQIYAYIVQLGLGMTPFLAIFLPHGPCFEQSTVCFYTTDIKNHFLGSTSPKLDAHARSALPALETCRALLSHTCCTTAKSTAPQHVGARSPCAHGGPLRERRERGGDCRARRLIMEGKCDSHRK